MGAPDKVVRGRAFHLVEPGKRGKLRHEAVALRSPFFVNALTQPATDCVGHFFLPAHAPFPERVNLERAELSVGVPELRGCTLCSCSPQKLTREEFPHLDIEESRILRPPMALRSQIASEFTTHYTSCREPALDCHKSRRLCVRIPSLSNLVHQSTSHSPSERYARLWQSTRKEFERALALATAKALLYKHQNDSASGPPIQTHCCLTAD
jgi:hypothetical protein